MTTQTVGVFIFDDVEVLDFCGPFEVFSVAARKEVDSDGSLFRAVTIAQEGGIVTCVGGLRVEPRFTIANHPALDILVIPGGFGTRKLMRDKGCLEWLVRQNGLTQLTTSVCTGSLLLAEAGILIDGPATSHWQVLEFMRKQYPTITVVDDTRFVDRGHIITSAGISAGIDMALHVVDRLQGRDTAEWTARRMEYEWRPDTPGV